MEANPDDDFKDALDEADFQDASEGMQDGPDGSKIFTDPQGFKVQIPKKLHFDNSFEFESDDLKDIFQNVSPGNCALTEDMQNYEPLENFISYGKSQPVRLLYYPLKKDGPWSFTEQEIDSINKFKEYCKEKGRNVPESNNEILRQLYGKKFDIP